MNPFDVDFPLFIVAISDPNKPNHGSFVKFSDPIHKSCLPIFTDTDLADRYKNTVGNNDASLMTILKVKDKTVLGNVLKSVRQQGCQYVTVDFFFREQSAVATFTTVDQFIDWCDK